MSAGLWRDPAYLNTQVRRSDGAQRSLKGWTTRGEIMNDTSSERSRNDDDLACCEVLLEYARDKVRLHMDCFDRLDSKAGTVVGFGGVIAALGALAAAQLPGVAATKLCPAGRVAFWVCVAGYTSLFVSLTVTLLFSISAVSLRRVLHPAAISRVIGLYRSLDGALRKDKLVKSLIRNMSKTEDNVIDQTRGKATSLRKATHCMIWGVFSLLVVLLSMLFLSLCGMV